VDDDVVAVAEHLWSVSMQAVTAGHGAGRLDSLERSNSSAARPYDWRPGGERTHARKVSDRLSLIRHATQHSARPREGTTHKAPWPEVWGRRRGTRAG
jgi:hypothetical protein